MIIKISDSLIKISKALKNAETMPSSADLKNLKDFLENLGQTRAKKLLNMKCAFDKESKLGIFSKGMLNLLAFFVLKGMSLDEINDTTFLDLNTHWKNLTVEEKEDLSDLDKKLEQQLKEYQAEKIKQKKDTSNLPGTGTGIEFIYPKQQKNKFQTD